MTFLGSFWSIKTVSPIEQMAKHQQQQQMKKEQETLAMVMMVAAQTAMNHCNSELIVGKHKLLSLCKQA